MASSGPNSTTGTLLYLVPPPNGERAYQHINSDPATGERKRNFTRQEKTVVIENVRGKEANYSLDTTGYQFYKHKSTFTNFTNDAAIRSEYYPESIALLKKLTGASRIELFDHTIRRNIPGATEDTPDKRQPVPQVHIDQTTPSSIARVHRHLPASDVPKLLAGRFQIINLWRPIANPALDWPLALCDYRSVDAKQDPFPVALVYPDHEGETYGVRYNKSQRWTYLHGMTPEEIVLIKCFDSVQDGSVAVFTPHTGFKDPQTPEGAPLRQSIELRALVFYD